MNDDTGRRKRVLAALTCGALCAALLAWLLPLAARAPFGGPIADQFRFFPKWWHTPWAAGTEVVYTAGLVVVTLCLMLYFWWINWEPEPRFKPRDSRSRPWLP